MVEVLADAGHLVVSMLADDPDETQGVNDRAQLAVVEAELRRRTNDRWMREGVGIVDPAATYLDATVVLAPDVTLFPGHGAAGRDGGRRGQRDRPATRLVDSRVGEGPGHRDRGHPAEIGDGAVSGPFAVLEPGARVGSGVRTGPFYTGGHG